jgi:hypothetical protein
MGSDHAVGRHRIFKSTDILFVAGVSSIRNRARAQGSIQDEEERMSRIATLGGLMSYGADLRAAYRLGATYVGQILQGAQAGEPARAASHESRAGHQS